MKKLAILIPCYNEAQTIEKVILDFRTQLPYADIYVFDNNSTDNSVELADAAGAHVRFVSHQGKGNVLRYAFRTVNADCYLMTDGDDTYPAEFAHQLIEPILNQTADMVIGDRLSSTYFSENKRRLHGFGNKLVRFLINKLWKSNIHDIMSGYRAFSRAFVKLYPVLSPGFEVETEMTIHALDKRFNIKEITIPYRDRPEGSFSKLSTVKDGFKVLKTISHLFKYYKPFVFFTWIALFFLIISLVLFISVFTEFIETGIVPRFPTLIVSGFLGLIAVVTFFTGLVSDGIIKRNIADFELKYIAFTSTNQS